MYADRGLDYCKGAILIERDANFTRAATIKPIGSFKTICREDRMRRPAAVFTIALTSGR
jgi:hypothetical protein